MRRVRLRKQPGGTWSDEVFVLAEDHTLVLAGHPKGSSCRKKSDTLVSRELGGIAQDGGDVGCFQDGPGDGGSRVNQSAHVHLLNNPPPTGLRKGPSTR